MGTGHKLHSLNEVPQFANQLNAFLTAQLRPNNPWSLFEEYPAVYETPNSANVWLILSDSPHPVIIGTVAAIQRQFNSADSAQIFILSNLLVDPQFRGQGLSKILVAAVIAKAQELGLDAVILWSDLLDYYTPLGFKPVGSEVLLNWQKTIPHFEIPNTLTPYHFSNFAKENANFEIVSKFNEAYQSKKGLFLKRHSTDWTHFFKIPQTFWFYNQPASEQEFTYGVIGKGADMQGVLHEFVGSWWALFSLINYAQQQHTINYWLLSSEDYNNLLKWLYTLPKKNQIALQQWLSRCQLSTRNICLAYELNSKWTQWMMRHPHWHVAGLDSF